MPTDHVLVLYSCCFISLQFVLTIMHPPLLWNPSTPYLIHMCCRHGCELYRDRLSSCLLLVSFLSIPSSLSFINHLCFVTKHISKSFTHTQFANTVFGLDWVHAERPWNWVSNPQGWSFFWTITFCFVFFPWPPFLYAYIFNIVSML